MLEKTWRKKICDELRKCNALVFPIIGGVASGFKNREGVRYSQEPGLPDVYVAHSYWQGFVEFKAEKTKLTEKQKYIIGELNKRNKISAVICRYGSLGVHSIQNEKGEILGDFTSALDLLKVLRDLKQKGLPECY